MTLHFRPAKDNDPTRHSYTRDCVCKPRVTVNLKPEPELIIEHKSDIPWSWAAKVAREV